MDPTVLAIPFLLYLAVALMIESTVQPHRRGHEWLERRASLTRLVILAVFYAFWLGVFWRPWMAAFASMGTVLLFAMVGNIKKRLLFEPLVFLDLQLVQQVLQHPKLYYSEILTAPRHVTLTVTAILVLLAAVLAGAHAEAALPGPADELIRLALMLLPLALYWLPRVQGGAEFVARHWLPGPAGEKNPDKATSRWGQFVPLFAHYCAWIAEGRSAAPRQPNIRPLPVTAPARGSSLPHIVAVQCESFVNPARYFHHPPELPAFASARESAVACGILEVPAGGAYTMRTEFAFLSGLPGSRLGFDAYNPYVRADRRPWPSLARALSECGYATDFIHPHDMRFFRRDRVMPSLGFQHMHGEERFSDADRLGPYVSDEAVARCVLELLEGATQPRFVFAVTMENHGPWRPGRLDATEHDERQIYFRHLQSADRAIHLLMEAFNSLERPVVFCFFGDHTPLLHFDTAEPAASSTDYFIQATAGATVQPVQDQTLAAHQLAPLVINEASLALAIGRQEQAA
jgi:hypothetical protein